MSLVEGKGVRAFVVLFSAVDDVVVTASNQRILNTNGEAAKDARSKQYC